MNMNRIFFSLVLVALPLTALASEDGTLSLSPAVVMLRGNFGQSTTQTLTLRNGTSRAFSFDLVARDVVVRNGKRAFAEAGSIPGSIAATAVFTPKQVNVPPGATVVVTVTVTLLPNTPQRAIVALFRGTNTVMSGHVPMTASLGTLLTFNASDDVQMSVSPLAVRAQNAVANLGVSSSCTNTGREPLVAKGVMAVLDARGSLVGRSELRPQRLMPRESTQIAGEYGGELAPGHYRVLVTYEFEGRSESRSAEVEIR